LSATPGDNRFDLQSHSTCSDGELAPREVVAAAARAGVTVLALSDHDTVDGVDEALAAGGELGVRVVPTVELSIVDDAAEDLHVLGYGIDHRAPELLARLREFRADRDSRADRMAAKLRELGFAIDPGALDERRAAGKPIGRPHLAKAVLGANANAAMLADEGIGDVTDFIRAYLIAGRPGFAGRTHPDAGAAIALIHEFGGVAVWAHPFWDISEPERVIATLDRFAALGVDGVEAFYVTHDREQTLMLADAAAQRGLLASCSSDYHGPEHRLFSRFLAFELHDRVPVLGAIAG
jgi:predicted metal-dependent phosphoesterase TrpH